MKKLPVLFKDPKTVPIFLATAALVLSGYVFFQNLSQRHSPQVAVADMQSIMDAQKLIWVERMKKGNSADVLNDSRNFQSKLQAVLSGVVADTDTIIIDKNSLVAGKNVPDVTNLIMDRLGLSASETAQLRQELEDDLFGENDWHGKDRP